MCRFVVVVAAALLVVPLAGVARGEAPFSDATYAEALREAKSAGKPIMIDFYTSWCAPCRELDRVTWKDSAVKKFMAEHMIALKVDAESETGVPLARQFGVRAYPTLLFVDANGRQIGRLMGFKDAVQFIEASAGVLDVEVPEIDTLARKRELAHNRGAHGRATFAKELVALGHYEEAMGEYMWCLENGAEDRTFSVIRTSTLIDEIATLGSMYPPMASAIRSYGDGLRADLIAGRADWGEATLLLRLRDKLPSLEAGADGQMLEVFDAAVAAPAPSIIVKRLRQALMGELLDAGREADAMAGRDVVREAHTAVRRVLGSEAQYKRSLKDLPPETVEALMRAHRRGFLDSMSRYYELFLSVGQVEDAESIRAETLEFDGSWYAGLAMARGAVRAGHVDASHVKAAARAHEATGGIDAGVAATYIEALVATGEVDKARSVAERTLASAELKGDRDVVKRALEGG